MTVIFAQKMKERKKETNLKRKNKYNVISWRYKPNFPICLCITITLRSVYPLWHELQATYYCKEW